jgi:hypothetical protein
MYGPVRHLVVTIIFGESFRSTSYFSVLHIKFLEWDFDVPFVTLIHRKWKHGQPTLPNRKEDTELILFLLTVRERLDNRGPIACTIFNCPPPIHSCLQEFEKCVTAVPNTNFGRNRQCDIYGVYMWKVYPGEGSTYFSGPTRVHYGNVVERRKKDDFDCTVERLYIFVLDI